MSDSTEATNIETTGAYPADFSQLEDQGDFSILKDNPADEQSISDTYVGTKGT